MEGYQCSKGWSNRCANAKGTVCKCACGGHNHGGKKNPYSARQPSFEEIDKIEKSNPVFAISDGYSISLARNNGETITNVPHKIVYHSPSGFEWGYGGSGPADLALNILAVFVPDKYAMQYHQAFKWAFIAPMPHEGGIIYASDIRQWIEANIKVEGGN